MLSINAKVHNHFDFVVQDVQTGKVKQTARAYNIVLDTYFSYVLNSRNPLHSITLGIGTGEPATTDTALFSAIITKQATEVEKKIEYPTSYVKKKIVLEPTECVGQDITEVGFVGNYYYYGNRYDLVTHAMLKDAEGNQIVVHKTEEDIITVYATFYATIGTETGGKYLLPTAEKNTVLSNMLFGGGYAANYPQKPLSEESWKRQQQCMCRNCISGLFSSFPLSVRRISYISQQTKMLYTVMTSMLLDMFALREITAKLTQFRVEE